jgi:hypothetical protein
MQDTPVHSIVRPHAPNPSNHIDRKLYLEHLEKLLRPAFQFARYGMAVLFALALTLGGCAQQYVGPRVFLNPVTRQILDCDAEGEIAGAAAGGRTTLTRAYNVGAAKANCINNAQAAGYEPLR